MVVEHEAADLRLGADLERLIGRRVAVVRELRVLLGEEVGVVDDGVDARQPRDERLAHRTERGEIIGRQRLGAGEEVLLVEHLVERRGVGDVRPRRAIAVDAIADGAERMVERDRHDVKAADHEVHAGLDLMEVELRRHRLERHREELVTRDAADHLIELVGRGEQRVHGDLGAGDVRRREERQPLDVVPVDVREQHMVMPRFTAGLARELVAELAHAGAGVDDHGLSGCRAGLDARRLAAILDGRSAGHRVTPPHPPERDLH